MLIAGCGGGGDDSAQDSAREPGEATKVVEDAGNGQLEEEIEVATEIAQGQDAVRTKMRAALRESNEALRAGEECLDFEEIACANREAARSEKASAETEKYTKGLEKLNRLMNRLSRPAIEAALKATP
jgi:hypothetical protein